MSPDPTQQSGLGLGMRLLMVRVITMSFTLTLLDNKGFILVVGAKTQTHNHLFYGMLYMGHHLLDVMAETNLH